MSSKQVAVEFVTHHFCDICGSLISDGSHDGGGGINFWGTYVRMKTGELKKIELETKPYSFSQGLIVEISYDIINNKSWELCKNCAGKVETFIKTEKFKKENEPN